MKNRNLIEKYAAAVYLYYTAENKVTDIHDYPDYIAEEIGLGFSIPFIKRLFRDGLLSEGNGVFTVTEKGQKYLEDNSDCVKFFNINSPYATYVEFAQFAQTLDEKDLGFYEIAQKFFEEKVQQIRAQRRYLGVESLHMELADICLERDQKKEALFHYLVYLCYAMSGIKEYIYIRRFKNKKITKAELLMKYRFCINVNPYAVLGIESLQEFYDESMVDEVYDSQNLGFTLCSRKLFKEVLASIMKGDYRNAYWQSRIMALFKKRMGFVPANNKKAQEKLKNVDAGQSEPVQEDSQIINADDEINEDIVSDAMQDEIAETESKVR